MKMIKEYLYQVYRYWMRRAIMWATLKRLKDFGAAVYIEDVDESMKTVPTDINEVRGELAAQLMTELIAQGVITFRSEKDLASMKTIVYANIIALK